MRPYLNAGQDDAGRYYLWHARRERWQFQSLSIGIPIFEKSPFKKERERDRQMEKTKTNSNKVLFSRNPKMRLEESMCSHTLASFFFTFLQFQFFFYDRGWYASLSSILLTIVMVIADFYQLYFLNELGIFLYIVKSTPPWGFMAPRSLEWAYNLLRWVR